MQLNKNRMKGWLLTDQKSFLLVWPRLQHLESSVGMEQKNRSTCACVCEGRGEGRLSNHTRWVRSSFRCCVRASAFEKSRINANGGGCRDIAYRSGAAIRLWPNTSGDTATKATVLNLSSSFVFVGKCYKPLAFQSHILLPLLGNVNNSTGLVSDWIVFAIRRFNQVLRGE